VSILRKLLDDEEAMGLLSYPLADVLMSVVGVLLCPFSFALGILDPCGIGLFFGFGRWPGCVIKDINVSSISLSRKYKIKSPNSKIAV